MKMTSAGAERGALGFFCVCLISLLSACATSSRVPAVFQDVVPIKKFLPPISAVNNPDGSLAYSQVEEFFITDRDKEFDGNKRVVGFNADRGEVSYGRLNVTIPNDHVKGKLESSIFGGGEGGANVAIKGPLRVEGKDRFFEKLNERIELSKDKALLIFVHGYNNSFVDTAKVLGQMTSDIEFSGAALFFSWPSQGRTVSYFEDRLALEWAQVHLEQALSDILAKVKTNKVYLVSHSMGSRALVRSLIAPNKTPLTNIKEVVLMSPDIDTEVFKNDLGPKLVALNRPITLYVSSKDIALQASRKINEHERAGDSSHEVLTIPGIETIDVSGVDASRFGHSYFSESREVMADLYYLIKFGQSASQRFGLQEVNGEEGRYWRLVK